MPSEKVDVMSLPPELREVLYKLQLKGIKVFYVKAKFVKGKQSKPFHNQWLVPASITAPTLLAASPDLNTEFYSAILRKALRPNHRIIARVQNFDFRPLQGYIKSLDVAHKNKINNAAEPKLIVLLSITNTHEIDAKKLGQWLKFVKTDEAGVNIAYHIGDVVRPDLFCERIERLRSALDADADMYEIFRSCAIWKSNPQTAAEVVESWYEEDDEDDEYEPDEDEDVHDVENVAEEASDGNESGEPVEQEAVDQTEGVLEPQQEQEAKDSSTRNRVVQEFDDTAIGSATGLAALFGMSHTMAYGQEEDDKDGDADDGEEDLDSDMMSSDGGFETDED